MSKGPGRIERLIEGSFRANPDQAPTTEELAELVFPGANRIEKKHRVSVLRAGKKVCERLGEWSWCRMEALGGGLVFWNIYSVTSYATMRSKCEMFANYRSHDRRLAGWSIKDAQQIAASLAPGGKNHDLIAEGGHWWRHVQMNIARRDGDDERLGEFQAIEDGIKKALRIK